jgi:hypothetical protein
MTLGCCVSKDVSCYKNISQAYFAFLSFHAFPGLLDVDASAFWNGSLGNDDAENAVLQGRLDCILVHPRWEAEASSKFSDMALGDPAMSFWCRRGLSLGWLRRWCWCCSLGALFSDGRCVGWFLILDGSLVRFDAAGLGCRSVLNRWLLLAFDCFRAATRFRVRFGSALDSQGVLIDELDAEMLLVDTRKFTLKRVCLLGLVDVEARIEWFPSLARCPLKFIEGLIK